MKKFNITISYKNTDDVQEIMVNCNSSDHAVNFTNKNIIIGGYDLIIPIDEVSRIEVWSYDWDERYDVFEF